MKESFDGYENLQGKCMMYLLSSKELFNNTILINSLESRFLHLIWMVNDFVSNELNEDFVKGESRASEKVIRNHINQIECGQQPHIDIVSDKLNNVDTHPPLDDDLYLSS